MLTGTRSVLAFVLAGLAPALAAQDEYRWEQNDVSKVRFRVFKKLQPIPLKLGETQAEFRMKFEPIETSDRIQGKYGALPWFLHLLEFKKTAAATTTGNDAPSDAAHDRGKAAADFRQWVTERDEENHERKFVTKGTDAKGKGKTPAHKWWDYTDSHKMTNGRDNFDQLFWTSAAVYDFPDRQVALVCRIPVKKDKPDPKHVAWVETMLHSLEPIEAAEGDDPADKNRDAFANTPERKAALEAAKANIANLKDWDYFTSPNYIVLYSWDATQEASAKRPDSLKFAKMLTQKLEDVREQYIKDFPPHDKMLQIYSIFRICENFSEYRRYSGDGLPPGAVGWFSPFSKELVVFNDRQHVIQNSKDIFTTTQHEGWHQYAQTYFGEKNELHRWFDEGHGDYYGGFTKKGTTWSYLADRGRHTDIRTQISRKTYVPLREIVAWNKDKFYEAAKAPFYYAEGYSLVDFLRRGPEVLGKKFDERWGKVIDIYRSTALETHDQKKAVEAAFAGVDWEQFEAAWVDWVRNSMK